MDTCHGTVWTKGARDPSKLFFKMRMFKSIRLTSVSSRRIRNCWKKPPGGPWCAGGMTRQQRGGEDRRLGSAGCSGRLDRGAEERAGLFIQAASRRVPALGGFAGLARAALAAGGAGCGAAEHCFHVCLGGEGRKLRATPGQRTLSERQGWRGWCDPGERESESELGGSRALPARPQTPREAASPPQPVPWWWCGGGCSAPGQEHKALVQSARQV